MPPATEPAAPPMNIIVMKKSLVRSVIPVMLRAVNPAVRALMASKMLTPTLSATAREPIVASLEYSLKRKTEVAASHRNRLVTTIILVSRLNRLKLRRRNTSTVTAQPMPPSIMSPPTKMSMGILESKPSRLADSGTIVRPALLKLETERKADCHSASPKGKNDIICQKMRSIPTK